MILCRKIFYDSPLIGFNSLNVNTRRYYATLSNNKHKINDLQIDPWFITGFSFIFFSFALNQATNSEQKKKK
jgi:hypothetical protein